MYFDYIERAETRLGLSGQPRFVVRHVKPDRQGVPREHYHCVWSRIDAEHRRAIPMPFDHEKLMMVTREFARDHGLRLPDGYNKDVVRSRRGRSYQMSLYAKRSEELGSLSLEQHKARVTAAWDRRDTPRSFVRELEDMGYILATGTRDYVVDLYGVMKSLPRLIDEKKVRIKDVREFSARSSRKTRSRASRRPAPMPPRTARHWSRSRRTSGGPPARRMRSSAASSCTSSSSHAGKRSSRTRRRFPSGSGGPATSSPNSKCRRGPFSGKAICTRAGASKSSAPPTARRGWRRSSAASPASS